MLSALLRAGHERGRAAGRRALARARSLDRTPAGAVLVAAAAGGLVFLISTTVFPYHSSNHDEAVYLTQAAMLLEGQLELAAGELAEAVRPWFFLQDGGRLYPKYTPVPATMFAASMALVGEPRLTLAAVAAGNTGLVYVLGAMLADRRVGLVAALLFAGSPLALVTSSVFLPYAPTTLLNLLFAVSYLRSVRDRSLIAAGVGGLAAGAAFFSRPYTAVLFAAPFVVHAGSRSLGSLVSVRAGPGRAFPEPARRHGLTAALGGLVVVLALAYNARLTGAWLTFPYEAFAPRDGLGFGDRQILDHSLVYTPELAVRANAHVLWALATRWFVAGPIGTAFALAGLGLAVGRWVGRGPLARPPGRLSPIGRTAVPLLAGVVGTVCAGNLLFWGNANVLGTMTDPTDGLIAQFGPIYHFDLLAPLSVFAAVALLTGWECLRDLRGSLSKRVSPGLATTGLLVVLVVLVASASVTGAVAAAAVTQPLDRNADYTDKYESAYAPVEAAEFEAGLVFVPTPYGDWQHHPFQYLRNDPGLDGPVVYALDRGPESTFDVIGAYPNRSYYRYTYQGEWTPDPDRHVIPKLEPLAIHGGTTVRGATTVGVPDSVERATVRLTTDGGVVEHTTRSVGESLRVGWSVNRTHAWLGAVGRASTVQPAATDTLVLTITLTDPDGSTLTYRQAAATQRTAEGVELVWPPDRSVCPLVTDCGTAGTYIPGDEGAHRDAVRFETQLFPVGTDTDRTTTSPPDD